MPLVETKEFSKAPTVFALRRQYALMDMQEMNEGNEHRMGYSGVKASTSSTRKEVRPELGLKEAPPMGTVTYKDLHNV